MKKCSQCKIRNRLKGRYICRECYNLYHSAYNRSNPIKTYGAHLKTTYGITIEQYERLKKEQNNLCAICKKEAKLYVDHKHNKKQIRGLLCNACNLMLGWARDNITTLEQAYLYLNRSKARCP